VRAAVEDAIGLEPIAMSGERLAALWPKQHAGLAAPQDLVAANHVVRVAMADGDAIRAAVLDNVVLSQAELDAPAEEQANVVATQLVAANDRPLRTRSGMQAETGVVVTVALLDDDIVTDLPADAVAVVLAGGQPVHADAVAVLQEDAAGVIAVEVVIVLAVA